MGKIEENKERKRREILRAAQDVFLSEGYMHASMDRIAAEAQVTKQTVYRYFPNKADLFKATLQQMGERSGGDFLAHLDKPDTREALHGFARDFVRAHLSQGHLATIRLLVAEGAKAPEITSSFFAVGPDETGARLAKFFADRLGVEDAETAVRLWTAMLLAFRTDALTGLESPSDQRLEAHVKEATDFLLAAIS